MHYPNTTKLVFMKHSRVFQSLRRHFSNHINDGSKSTISLWSESVSCPGNRVQSYISHSMDPYLNLSIEHYLLQNSPSDSTILFLYTNRPSIIIGRNQNPWLEANLGLLGSGQARDGDEGKGKDRRLGAIDLVRRRSGGGTVFHDEGNVNWSIICPPSEFTRDKHAEMIVRALRRLGIDRARVNERHDIVLDQGQNNDPTSLQNISSDDTHKTPYEAAGFDSPRPLKVSGSAYKLTRTRALHHGTCLLSSPNLHIIPKYLHSPAKLFIKARGVESVSSPVSNIGVAKQEFERSVQDEFFRIYGPNMIHTDLISVGDHLLDVHDIFQGVEELKTADWIYGQTPQFTFSNSESQVLENSVFKALAGNSELQMNVTIRARHGIVEDFVLHPAGQKVSDPAIVTAVQEHVIGKKLYEIDCWSDILKGQNKAILRMARWLNLMLPSISSQNRKQK